MTGATRAADRAVYGRLSFFYASYFLLAGLMLPYWPVWLNARGLSVTDVGLVLSVSYWLKTVVQPLIARRADQAGENRRIMVILAALAVLAMASLTVGESLWLVALMALVVASFQHAILPLGESAVLATTAARGLDYGRVRLWGSVTFIIASVAGGLWLERFAPASLIWLFLIAMGAVILGCLGMVPARRTPAKIHWREMAGLIAERRFLVFLAAVGLTQASHAVMLAYGALYWLDLGISENLVGQLYGAGVVAEIILFALIGKLAPGLSPARFIAFGALAGVIRWPLTAMLSDPLWLFPLQSLHALTFGATHLGAMAFLSRHVPARLSATGQALYAAMIGGVLMGAAMAVSALAYDRLAGDAYWVMGLFSLAGLVAAAVLAMITPRPPLIPPARPRGAAGSGSARH